MPPPTDEVRRLVQVVGAEAALALTEAHGGTRLYIPVRPTERLVALLGPGAAEALCEAHGREYLKVPFARQWRILAYKAQGLSYAMIARRAGCTENTVWRVLAERGQTRQYDLFGS